MHCACLCLKLCSFLSLRLLYCFAGRGLKVRTRLYRVSPPAPECEVQLMEKSDCEGDVRTECEFDREDARRICGLKKETGPCRGNFPRWYFDNKMEICLQFMYGGCRGNSNNFEEYEDCMQLCELAANGKNMTAAGVIVEDFEDLRAKKKRMMGAQQLNRQATAMKTYLMVMKQREMANREKALEDEMRLAEEGPVIDCVVTAWSPWSQCHGGECGSKAFKRKFRKVERFPSEGGRKCPKKMERFRKCKEATPCENECLLGSWGQWSPCSSSCGEDGTQERTREIVRDGERCGPRVQKRFCLLQECPD